MTNDTSAGLGASLEHRVGTRGRLSVRQPSGDVTIRGVEGDTIRVRTDDEEPLGDAYQVQTGDDFVELRWRDGLGGGGGLERLLRSIGRHESSDLLIEVPHGATVSIETAGGDIQASDLSGTKKFRTASGDVSLERLSGSVEFETVSGDAQVEAAAPLDVRGRTVSGDVQIEAGIIRTLDVSTTSGDMHLEADLVGNGPFALRTISGDTTVVARGGLRIEAETVTGEVSTNMPHRGDSGRGRRVFIVGRSGPTLAFRSVSGDLEVIDAKDKGVMLVREEPMRNDPGELPSVPDAPLPPSAPFAPPAPTSRQEPPSETTSDADATRMSILKQLERGEISVDDASERLAELDEVAS